MFPRHDGVLLGGSHDRGVWDMSVDPLVWVRGSPATGDLFWTPSGLQNGMPRRSCVCKSLRNLVGPPRFELGTSCTPSKRASQAAPRPEVSILRHTAPGRATRYPLASAFARFSSAR